MCLPGGVCADETAQISRFRNLKHSCRTQRRRQTPQQQTPGSTTITPHRQYRILRGLRRLRHPLWNRITKLIPPTTTTPRTPTLTPITTTTTTTTTIRTRRRVFTLVLLALRRNLDSKLTRRRRYSSLHNQCSSKRHRRLRTGSLFAQGRVIQRRRPREQS